MSLVPPPGFDELANNLAEIADSSALLGEVDSSSFLSNSHYLTPVGNLGHSFQLPPPISTAVYERKLSAVHPLRSNRKTITKLDLRPYFNASCNPLTAFDLSRVPTNTPSTPLKLPSRRAPHDPAESLSGEGGWPYSKIQ